MTPIDELVEFWRAEDAVIGYTSGAFDLLHRGHRNYLAAASKYCDRLIVGVDSNRRVRERKGEGRPIEDELIRMTNVQAVEYVDLAFVKRVSSSQIVPRYQPDIWVAPDTIQIGPDRTRLLDSLSIELVVVPYTRGISTSRIITRRTSDE